MGGRGTLRLRIIYNPSSPGLPRDPEDGTHTSSPKTLVSDQKITTGENQNTFIQQDNRGGSLRSHNLCFILEITF